MGITEPTTTQHGTNNTITEVRTMSEHKEFVFKTDEIPHLWAHNRKSQGHAKNAQQNLYFTGDVIYSYRDSFPIGHIVTHKDGRECVLLQEDTYSNTTAKHCHKVWYATRHMLQFRVPDLVLNRWINGTELKRERKAHVNSNLDWYQREIETLECKVVRARSNAENLTLELTSKITEANTFAEWFGSRRRFTMRDHATIKQHMKVAGKKAKVEKAKQDASNVRRNAQLIREAQVKLEAWKEGELNSYVPSVIPETYLRVSKDGLNVETSLGAVVPVEHARLGLALVRSVVQSQVEYQRNGHTFHLGHYAVDSVALDGTLTAGCHVIKYSEIERIAPLLEATQATEQTEVTA